MSRRPVGPVLQAVLHEVLAPLLLAAVILALVWLLGPEPWRDPAGRH